MQIYLLKNIQVVNEGKIVVPMFYLKRKNRKMAPAITFGVWCNRNWWQGKYLLPGVIDDQVHFREPGYP